MDNTFVVIATFFCLFMVLVGTVGVISLWFNQPLSKFNWWKKYWVGDHPEDHE